MRGLSPAFTARALKTKSRWHYKRIKMHRSTQALFLALLLVAGCVSVGTGRSVVKGAGPEELLKLRAGPGLGYRVILGLPDGTLLDRHDCVTEVGQLWCRVSLADAPGIKGYVSADYISER